MKVVRIALMVGLSLTASGDATAFTHVVRPKETLADIAKKLYGDATREVLLAGANALDSQGGSAIVPGMHLVAPANDWHRVAQGHETWASIARDFLGDDGRADFLARANDAIAWAAPSPGQEVRIPYVLTYIAAEGDTTLGIARKYLGDQTLAWEINTYNGRKDWKLLRGEVVLVPIARLDLTDTGRAEASGEDGRRRESGGGALAAQKKAAAEIPQLLGDLRAGHWVEAVARGNRLLASADLSRAQLASIQRALVEAYVALDATPQAQIACDEWRRNEAPESFALDPIYVSPKIREACARTR
jgi:LysM repeat protein